MHLLVPNASLNINTCEILSWIQYVIPCFLLVWLLSSINLPHQSITHYLPFSHSILLLPCNTSILIIPRLLQFITMPSSKNARVSKRVSKPKYGDGTMGLQPFQTHIVLLAAIYQSDSGEVSQVNFTYPFQGSNFQFKFIISLNLSHDCITSWCIPHYV